jgi:ankyrin repeat protein
MTALHYAALMGRGDIVDLLLKHGADPTVKARERGVRREGFCLLSVARGHTDA